MLYWAAKHLAVHYSVFNVFSYLTLRSILAAMSSMAIALIVGPYMISRLARYQIGQVVRDDGPQSHLPKAGTPTMGGMLIIFAVVLTTTLAVVAMTAAGIAMCALARVGKGIKTTMLLHWATNSLGFFAAWLLLH